jgi:hypothetical protein
MRPTRPRTHDDDPVGKRNGLSQVVRDEQHRHSAQPRQELQLVQHHQPKLGIECSERLTPTQPGWPGSNALIRSHWSSPGPWRRIDQPPKLTA